MTGLIEQPCRVDLHQVRHRRYLYPDLYIQGSILTCVESCVCTLHISTVGGPLSDVFHLSLETSALGDGEDGGADDGNGGRDGDGCRDDNHAVVGGVGT